jgi:hypothetical protein
MAPREAVPMLLKLSSRANWSMACVLAMLTARSTLAEDAPHLGPETVTTYRFGAKVVAADAAVKNAKIVMAVPLECPEQQVKLLGEDVTAGVAKITHRQPNEGVRQMVIAIRNLAAGEEAHAYATFEVRTRIVLPPVETAPWKIPKRAIAALRPYLKPGSMIDVKAPPIREAVDAALAKLDDADGDGATDWARVEALYDYALEHVEYELGDDKSSIDALADGRGDCQAIAATFVAMCRTLGVPARMVWVDGHQYAEFYLESAPGQGAWHPVESAGSRSFGGMPLARVILQKGDAIRVPERPRELLRYASDFAVFPTRPETPPTITFVRERVGDAVGRASEER